MALILKNAVELYYYLNDEASGKHKKKKIYNENQLRTKIGLQ